MSTHTLSIEEFTDQLAECGIAIFTPCTDASVVIRSVDGDYAVAAVHMDKGGTLIFDMGLPMDGQKGKHDDTTYHTVSGDRGRGQGNGVGAR